MASIVTMQRTHIVISQGSRFVLNAAGAAGGTAEINQSYATEARAPRRQGSGDVVGAEAGTMAVRILSKRWPFGGHGKE